MAFIRLRQRHDHTMFEEARQSIGSREAALEAGTDKLWSIEKGLRAQVKGRIVIGKV